LCGTDAYGQSDKHRNHVELFRHMFPHDRLGAKLLEAEVVGQFPPRCADPEGEVEPRTNVRGFASRRGVGAFRSSEGGVLVADRAQRLQQRGDVQDR
jgi:hypothetical protein